MRVLTFFFYYEVQRLLPILTFIFSLQGHSQSEVESSKGLAWHLKGNLGCSCPISTSLGSSPDSALQSNFGVIHCPGRQEGMTYVLGSLPPMPGWTSTWLAWPWLSMGDLCLSNKQKQKTDNLLVLVLTLF